MIINLDKGYNDEKETLLFPGNVKRKRAPDLYDLYLSDCQKKKKKCLVLKHITGAYSRNAAVGLLLCSKQLFELDRKEE